MDKLLHFTMVQVNYIHTIDYVYSIYISHNSFPEIMMRVNLIIRVKESTLYIVNNYCKTHLFTNVLLSGH